MCYYGDGDFMFSNKIICEILEYIDINLNSKITIKDLENKVFYNKFYIVKLFKKEIGYTIFDYINHLRISNSVKDISDSDKSFTRIALDNGFYSLEYFSEIFKKVMGVSPRVYKKYLDYNNELDEDIKFLIRDNLIKLNDLINYKDKYLNNVKPDGIPVKKLTIFK